MIELLKVFALAGLGFIFLVSTLVQLLSGHASGSTAFLLGASLLCLIPFYNLCKAGKVPLITTAPPPPIDPVNFPPDSELLDRDRGLKACVACETVGKMPKKVKGNFLIELILWVCFLVPGIIYSIWRSSSSAPQCPSCGSRNIVPLHTPKGIAIFERQGEAIKMKIRRALAS